MGNRPEGSLSGGAQRQPTPVQHASERVSAQLLDEHPGDEQGRMLHGTGPKTAGTFTRSPPKTASSSSCQRRA